MPDRNPDAAGQPNRRKQLAALLVAVAAIVALFAAGWWTSQTFVSPAQRDAAASAPPRVAVTAEVVRGGLSNTLTSKAVLARSSSQTVSIPAGETPSIVTDGGPAVGTEISSGSKLLEINGRPLIAIEGDFPFYRDLVPGDKGPDVEQLQNALNKAGFNVVVDGSFGASTTSAATALFQRLGYSIETVTTTDATNGEDGSDVSKSPAKPDSSAAGSTATGKSPAVAEPEPIFHRDEFLVVKDGPDFVQKLPAQGAELDGSSAAVLSRGAVVATAPVAATVIPSLKVGMTGTLEDAGGETSIRVSAITRPDKGGMNGSVTLEGKPKQLDARLAGQTLLATIDAEVVAKDSLIVPTIAVVTTGTDAAFVLKADESGAYERVPVRELGQLSGQSAIEPTTAGAVRVGDQVRVGR